MKKSPITNSSILSVSNRELSEDSDEMDDQDYFEMSTLITRVNLESINKIEEGVDFAQIYSKLASQTKAFKLFSNDGGQFEANSKIKNEYNYIIREILTTEETFLSLMKILIEDFLKPLSMVMTQEERRNTSINIGLNKKNLRAVVAKKSGRLNNDPLRFSCFIAISKALFNLSMLANSQSNRMIGTVFIGLERSMMDFFGKTHHLGIFFLAFPNYVRLTSKLYEMHKN
jgi:hypothetical protein